MSGYNGGIKARVNSIVHKKHMGKIADTFKLNKTYLAVSKKTKKPYISQNGECFAFVLEEKMDKFVSAHEDVSPEYGWHKFDKLKADCYQAGGSILILEAEENTKESYPLRKKELEIRYYNHPLSQAAAFIKHGYDIPSQLQCLAQCRFIVPCKIRTGEGTAVTYAIASKDDAMEDFKYISFTSLDEYESWKDKFDKTASKDKEQTDIWQPFEIDYSTLYRISKRHGIIIDPTSTMLVIAGTKLPKPREDDGSED